MILRELEAMNGAVCSCGRRHSHSIRKILSGAGALGGLPSAVLSLGGTRPFVLCDETTDRVAGARVREMLASAGFAVRGYIIPGVRPHPCEETVGAVLMHYPADSDIVVSVGSGVVNDIGKILSAAARVPYIVVGTAPSMDGYASATSSVTRDGLKVSLRTRSPDVIIGDSDILKTAPDEMLRAGLGDMIAKYVGIAEWRISHIVNGEEYCEAIAALVRRAVAAVAAEAEGLMRREESAIRAVFEGLVVTGVAMAYAGSSRPASGAEHYISHLWDMRGAALGTKTDLHGIQCAVGTCEVVRAYERLAALPFDRAAALASVGRFDPAAWQESLRALLGPAALPVIALEEREGKYDKARHRARLETILARREEILAVLREELPPSDRLVALLRSVGAPVTPEELGQEETFPLVFRATKDVRDKYILTRLLWDLGLLDAVAP